MALPRQPHPDLQRLGIGDGAGVGEYALPLRRHAVGRSPARSWDRISWAWASAW